MKYLPLILRNLMRRKVRTAFTILSVFIAFMLFGLLAGIRTAFTGGAAQAEQNRLITIHKISLIQPLPIKYGNVIEAIEGVTLVTHQDWFGGYYQNVRNQFQNMAVDGDTFFAMYPEYLVPEEQMRAWQANRTGAIIGEKLAERFGWEVGDRVPLQGTIWVKRDGSTTWEFDIEGIYRGANESTDTSGFFFHHEYLVEAGGPGGGTVPDDFTWDMVGWYTVRIEDPAQAAQIGEIIDSRFANSDAETKTSSEEAFAEGFANQIGNIGAIVSGIVAVVFFTLLLVAGNTMAHAVRERTGELAVLKTIGFSDRKVLGLVLAEALALALIGGIPGLLVSRMVVGTLNFGSFFPEVFLPAETLPIGVALILLLGIVTGVLPALRAMRLDIVSALRKT